MTAAMTRYDRYLAVVNQLHRHAAFALTDAKKACDGEQPAFVTRVVNMLARDGWIVRAEEAGTQTYRWNSSRGEFPLSRWLDEKLYGSQIKESPLQDRPRERLIALGPEKLKVAELLAILIRSGRPGESAVMAGDKLARAFKGRLQDLPGAGRAELKAISVAVEKTAWCQIMAGIELGRRIAALTAAPEVSRIESTDAALAYCRRRFARLASDGRQEEFHVVTLDTRNQVIDTHRVSVGTLNASLVHPREVFRPAVKDAAAAVLLVHNHPSGDATPSDEDLAITEGIEAAGETMGIEVLDHVVLAAHDAVSIHDYR